MAKFCHFGNILKVFGFSLRIYYLASSKILNLASQIVYAFGQIFIVFKWPKKLTNEKLQTYSVDRSIVGSELSEI